MHPSTITAAAFHMYGITHDNVGFDAMTLNPNFDMMLKPTEAK